MDNPVRTDSIVFEQVGIDKLDELVSLMSAAYGKAFDPAWYEWATFENPLEASRVYVARDAQNGELVGCNSCTSYNVIFNGKVTRAGYSTNTAVHPNYRKRGIYTDLMKHLVFMEAKRGTAIITGIPNDNSTRGFEKLEFEFPAPISILAKKPKGERDLNLEEVEAFDAAFDRLFERLESQFDFIVQKRSEFSNWRLSRPNNRYHIYPLREGGEWHGYVVMKTFEDPETGYRKAHVMDIMGLTDANVEQLLDIAEQYAADHDELNLWSMENDPYRPIFIKHGFVSEEKRRQIILKRLTDQEKPMGGNRWHYSYMDNDTY